jgi:large repetitive protein
VTEIFMPIRLLPRSARALALFLISLFAVSIVQAQGAKQPTPQAQIPDADADHVKERNEWFFRGRLVPGKSSAELRRRAYLTKLQLRAQHADALATARAVEGLNTTGPWTPLGPMPLASDATNGTQNYNQVAGRATAVAIDPADPTGNTVYIGGAQAGVWKSINAANTTANNVTWTPVTDDQATLSIGAIVIQPGNTNPANSLILAATGDRPTPTTSDIIEVLIVSISMTVRYRRQ